MVLKNFKEKKYLSHSLRSGGKKEVDDELPSHCLTPSYCQVQSRCLVNCQSLDLLSMTIANACILHPKLGKKGGGGHQQIQFHPVFAFACLSFIPFVLLHR